jgi:hypothetical protein
MMLATPAGESRVDAEWLIEATNESATECFTDPI